MAVPTVSPLFASVIWEKERFRILDETLLPDKLEYIVARSVADGVQAVREMKTRAFGQVLTFLYTMALAVKDNQGRPEPPEQTVRRVAGEFTRARPTFDFGRFVVFFLDWLREMPRGEEAGSWIEAQTEALVAKILRARTERARRAAELLPRSCRLLTHCNISGELVAILQYCRAAGKEVELFATETRPYFQGSRLTAWEAVQAGFKVHVIPDCAVAQIMARGVVDAVLVGADRSARNGDIVNKVGTYPIAVCAAEYGIPFYVVAQEPGSLQTGNEVIIEDRPVAELLTFRGRSLGGDGIQGYYPAFDVTPASLISSLISFSGVFTPEEFSRKFNAAPGPQVREREEGKRFLLLYGIPSAEAYARVSRAFAASAAESILLPEMRPQLWGLEATAPELLKRGLPVSLIADNMMGIFFARGAVERVYVCGVEFGQTESVGICGSLLAVLLARAHEIPLEFLPGDGGLSSPADRDVSTFCGEPILAPGALPFPIEPDRLPHADVSGKDRRVL